MLMVIRAALLLSLGPIYYANIYFRGLALDIPTFIWVNHVCYAELSHCAQNYKNFAETRLESHKKMSFFYITVYNTGEESETGFFYEF